MKFAITSFRGEVPRLTPRALPDNGAQIAENTRLFTGDLTAFKQFAPTIGLANGSTPIRTIYLLRDAWLSWADDVDVARGAVAGDESYRTYLTAPDLYAQPRFTDYALATTGSPPYPVATRPLGVPNPDASPTTTVGVSPTPSIEVVDPGDQFDTWSSSPQVGFPGAPDTTISLTMPQSSPDVGYYLDAKANYPDSIAYLYRDFGTSSSSNTAFGCDFTMTGSIAHAASASWRIQCTGDGNGPLVDIGYPSGIAGGLKLSLGTQTSWSSTYSILQSVDAPLAQNTQYRVEITYSASNTLLGTITASVYQGSSLLASVTASSYFTVGGFYGLALAANDGNNEYGTLYSNVLLQGSGSTDVATNTATSYVYTFVNDLGQESGPSPTSSTLLRPDGVSVTVTTPVDVPSGVSVDYGVTTKRIYRAATGNIGTVFRFVAEIPLTTADYVDLLTDSDLGETLISELWVLPPDDLQGILALPNGITAGFAKNQLCLSAQNYPHAWPIEYRLNTDTAIVGIGNVDNTVIIGTQSFVYIASGNDPAAYSMSKFEVPYACVSKKSFAYLTGIGVVFAGPDGLMAVSGPGQVRNLTDSIFTREQWQALNPSSIFGVAHNDIYWMFWENGSERGCYGIDMKANGFGLIRMPFYASAVYTDPIEDKLYMVLTEDNEPDDPLLPIPADPPAHIDGSTVFEFEGNPSVSMIYRFRGKLWLLPHPGWLTIFQVKAEDYDNILLRIYGDGAQIDELVVTEETEFTLAAADRYTRLEYEVLGTSTVRVLQGAEDITELD